MKYVLDEVNILSMLWQSLDSHDKQGRVKTYGKRGGTKMPESILKRNFIIKVSLNCIFFFNQRDLKADQLALAVLI